MRRRPIRCIRLHSLSNFVNAIDKVSEMTRPNKVVSKQHMNHGKEKRSICSGPDGMVCSSQFSGFRASRVNDNQLTAALSQ